MVRKFRDLVSETMSPESQARSAIRTKTLLAEMHLNELRRARDLSQQELADKLNTTQPEISKIERRMDVYVSTLRKFVRAVGGELEITARFANGEVRIVQFRHLEDETDTPFPVDNWEGAILEDDGPALSRQLGIQERYKAVQVPEGVPNVIPIGPHLRPNKRNESAFSDDTETRLVKPSDYDTTLKMNR